MASGHIGPGNLGPAPASATRAVRSLAGAGVWHRLIRCGRLLGVYQYPRARQRVRSVSGFDDGCICGLYCPGVQPAVFDLWPLVQPSTAGLGGGFPFTLAIGGMAALLAAHGLPLVVPGLRPPRFLAGGLGANTGGYGSRPHRGTQRGAGCPLARTMACQHPPPAPPLGLTVFILALWPVGLVFKQVSWTELNTSPISVGMVQPNIPQELKWRPEFMQPTLDRLMAMSDDLWHHDWLIWPEAAIPQVYHRMLPFLDQIHHQATLTNTALISGIIYDDPHQRQYYNSLAGFGTALGLYHKRRLVPFGEYVPLEEWLRGLIDFFDMPTSIIDQGPAHQRGIEVGEGLISPSVCYEVVYPDLVATSARDTQVLLTVSNDAWFADSLGPLQHMQMARMRALETGRYLVRSTNNGISAIVNPRGQITARSEQFVAQTLSGEVYPAQGMTPFMRWGSWPLALVAGALLCLLGCMRRWDEPPLELEGGDGIPEDTEPQTEPVSATGS